MSDLQSAAGAASHGMSRRAFLRATGTLIAGAAVSALGGALYATRAEPDWIEVTDVPLPLPGLPEALLGLTIVHLSDFHAGPYVSAADVRRSVKRANTLAADVLVLTGDFVYQSARYGAFCAQELAALRSRYGILAVLGNHDIWNGADELAANLDRAGIRVLRNEAVSLIIAGTELWLVGLEDTGYAGTDFGDFQEAWQGVPAGLDQLLAGMPAGAPRILLVHTPDFCEMLPEGHVDLVLSGHTHGGQVSVPFLGPPIVPSCFGQKYAAGLVAGPRAPVYVNRGIGLIPPPVRLNCRPEVTRLRLVVG
jgi:hypothetical protein